MADANNLAPGSNLPCSNVLSSGLCNLLNREPDDRLTSSDPLLQRSKTGTVAKRSLLGPQSSLCPNLARSQRLQKDRRHCCKMTKISLPMPSLFSRVATGILHQSGHTVHQCVDRLQSPGNVYSRRAKKSGTLP